MVVVPMDGPGEGFNDTTAVDPIGGNPGMTLGEQRLNLIQRAVERTLCVLTVGHKCRISAVDVRPIANFVIFVCWICFG